MPKPVSELCQQVINERGGACVGCDCRPKMSIVNSWGISIDQGSSSTDHNLSAAQLRLRVECDANSDSHRPYQGDNHETCRAREHLVRR